MLLYRLALTLAAPPLAALWLVRWLRGRETLDDLRERLGLGGPERPPEGPVLWLHAASVGEVTAARPLAEALVARRPALRLIVTCNTTGGRATARNWALPRTHVRLAPVDFRWCLRAFLVAHAPGALAIVENELWPNRLALATGRGLPVAIVAARLSARSAARWARLGGVIRPHLGRLAAVFPQDDATATRLRDLGLPERALGRATALKSAVTLAPADPVAVAALGYDRAETVLAASTHAGEEEQVLAAFAAARARRPGLRLILAPRHPERGPQIARLIAQSGLKHTSRSAGEAPGGAPVHLADTLGEMPLWYAAAGLCFVGGSLVPKGGHTPYEPARFGCAILHGPGVENAATAYARLDAAGGAVAVPDAEALGDALTRLDQDRQSALAARASAALGSEDVAPLAEALDRALGLAPQAERRG